MRMGGSTDMVLGDEWLKVLSPREREVALLVARGLTNKEVARELGLCDGTVKIHLHSIFQKLGAKSRYNLMRLNKSCLITFWLAISSEGNSNPSSALLGRERDRARAWFALRGSDAVCRAILGPRAVLLCDRDVAVPHLGSDAHRGQDKPRLNAFAA